MIERAFMLVVVAAIVGFVVSVVSSAGWPGALVLIAAFCVFVLKVVYPRD